MSLLSKDSTTGPVQELYEMPFRPAYEGGAAAVWALGTVATVGMQVASSLPPGPMYVIGGLCSAAALHQGLAGWRQYRRSASLSGRKLWLMDETDFERRRRKHQRGEQPRLWLGRGFDWGQQEAQRVYEIRKRGIDQELPDDGTPGAKWLHGIRPDEHDITIGPGEEAGHTILYGTTGSGKTRTFDLILAQKIAAGETVFIIDPKGDQGLREAAQRACINAGTPERFVYFNPAHPEVSARIDVMANWTRATELASRVAALMPNEGGGDNFQAFSWMALNHVCQALVSTGHRVNLRRLRRYIEGGPEDLAARALEQHLDRALEDWRVRNDQALARARTLEERINVMARIYERLPEEERSDAVSGILSMHRHERSHFHKMVVGLLPLLNMLTAEPLGELLSPDYRAESDPRPLMDSGQIIDAGQVVYIGLDSLTDSTVGSAIGSILLADLTAVAGEKYNYARPGEMSTVNVLIDEAAEVLNNPMIRLLNKGRGAGFKLFVATQTFPDLVERMGSKEAAAQVAGNCNNVIALRLTDPDTQTMLSEKLGKTVIRQIMHTQGTSAMGSDRDPTNWSGNYGERLIETEAELFPGELFGKMPNLQYLMHTAGGRVVKGRVPIIQSETKPRIENQTWLQNK